MDYRLQNDELMLGLTDEGGKLCSIDDREGNSFLWSGDPAYWDDRAPILFPFCGRCNDGCYFWEGRRYPMEIHGFLPHTRMDFLGQSGDEIVFGISSNSESLKIYPFEFGLEIHYRLRKRRIECEFRVRAGKTGLYFSLGGHPGFVLDGSGDYRLTFPDSADSKAFALGDRSEGAGSRRIDAYEITENGLLGEGVRELHLLQEGNRSEGTDTVEGKSLILSEDILGNCGLFLKNPPREAILSRAGGSHRIALRYPDFPTLGIWKPSGAPFVCLEPWNGLPAPDGLPTLLKKKPGTLRLAPGQESAFCCQIEIID